MDSVGSHRSHRSSRSSHSAKTSLGSPLNAPRSLHIQNSGRVDKDHIRNCFGKASGHVLKMTCILLHMAMLVVFFIEEQYYWVSALMVLLGFDFYAVCRICRYTSGVTAFWYRSFDTCIVGLPFAIFNFYGLFDSSQCPWSLPHNRNHWLDGLMWFAGATSFIAMGLASTELDFCANRDISIEMERSLFYSLSHLMFRTSEVSFRVCCYVLYCLCARPLLGHLGLPAPVPELLLCVPLFGLWLVYLTILRWASRCESVPRESWLSSGIIAYVALGPNPVVFLLDIPFYNQPAKRASVMFVICKFLEFIVLSVLVISVLEVSYPDQCPRHASGVGMTTLRANVQLISIAAASIVINAILFLKNPRLSKRLVCGRGGSQTILFIPHDTSSRWLVKDSPDVSMSTFLINQGAGQGFLARLVPVQPVNTNIYRVERQLGQGSYGLVVLVREQTSSQSLGLSDIRDSSFEPRRYALKLQSTGGVGHRRESPMRSPHVLAMRERDIYRRIWEQVDPRTGRTGHPFIVRLLCYSDWPTEKRLYYEGSDEPVEFVTKDKLGRSIAVNMFDSALLMEYCEQGTLEDYALRHMRRGEADETNEGALAWLTTARAFVSEILLALDFLHNSQSVIYRDLKLENVFVILDCEGAPHVKLGDFGFSKVVSDVEPPTSVAGSPYFAAPEMLVMQRVKRRSVTDWTLDVFSLGVVVFVLFYGAELEPARNKWELPHHRRHPRNMHPTRASEAFQRALVSLSTSSHCVPQAVDFIRAATQTLAENRPSIAQLKEYTLMKELPLPNMMLPVVDWEQLLSLDI